MEFGIANRIEQINGESGFVQTVDEVTIAAANGQNSVQYRIRETDFLWTAAVAVSTGAFTSRVQSATENRYFDSGPVRSENFWGTSQKPMRHPPKFLPLNGELNFEFIDTSGNAGNVIALYLWGKRAETCGEPGEGGKCKNPKCRCERARWGQGRGLFVLHTAGPTLSPTFAQGGITAPINQPVTAVVKVPDYYHLRVSAINGCAFNGASGITANTDWSGNVDRMDPRDERRWLVSNARMRANGWVGTAVQPAFWPAPIVGHKASQFGLDVLDLGGSTTNHIHLAFIGETLDDDLLAMGA